MPRPIPPPSPSPSPSPTTSSSDVGPTAAASDLNTMVVVAAIVCAFLCALGLHSMLQCAVQCANRALVEPVEWVQSRRLNSGLKKKDMVALPTSVYKAASSASPSPSRCAICLTDFSEGDKIRVLPKCNHRFHVACVDKWLLSHSSCPNCRNTVKSCENVTC